MVYPFWQYEIWSFLLSMSKYQFQVSSNQHLIILIIALTFYHLQLHLLSPGAVAEAED